MSLTKLKSHHGIWASLFTSGLLGLVLLALAPTANELAYIMLAGVLLAVLACTWLLPGSLFFTLSLVNFVAIYTCFFVFILDGHFRSIPAPYQWAGFLAPLLSFFGGALSRRREIRTIIKSDDKSKMSGFSSAILWLLPLLLIGVTAMLLAANVNDKANLTTIFCVAMGLTAVLVGIASRNVVIFLLDTGLLFEDLFKRAAPMMAPAFAFLTLYSLVILIFGASYAVIDRITDAQDFYIHGQLATISFPQALYFSAITLSTVGYGDITPASNGIRALATIEVVSGVMLLLFGFNEIVGYAREKRGGGL